MKKLYLALALSCFSVNALALTEGVIVHDAKSAIDTASQWVKEAKQWQKERHCCK